MRKGLQLAVAALAACLSLAIAGLATAYAQTSPDKDPTASTDTTDGTRPDSRPPGDSGTTSPFAPLATAAAAGPTPVVARNQAGLGPSTGINPGDPGGAVGPAHYIQAVNGTGVAVYRRSDLAPVAGPILGSTFANAPAGQEVLDAQFIWDDSAQRWFYSFTYKAGAYGPGRTSGILYGWSKTADPTDLAHGWCQMRIDTGADFEDRPKLATSANRIVLATNVDPIGYAYYSRVWTIPKPANGSTSCPANPQSGIQKFGTPQQPLRTADGNVADSPVPAIWSDGDANVYVVAADFNSSGTDSQIMVWHVDPSGTLVPDGNVAVSPYSNPPLAPQPKGYDSLDTIDRRLSNAVARTDPDAGAKAIWTQQSIADPAGTGRSVIRWYELIPSVCTGSVSCPSGARRQQGEVKDASNWLWNGAIAPTGAGNEAVLQYNAASSTQLAQIRAVSRVSSTPLSTMGDPVTIATSDAPDQDFTCFDSRPGCRWGDYTMASPDPNDPHLVWASNQVTGPYVPNVQHWKSRNFAVQPSASATLVHSATGAADTGAGADADGVVEPGESADVTETVRNSGGAAAGSITGTLQSLTPGLSVTSASADYPDIAAGGTGTGSSPFEVSAASSLPCGTPLSMTLSLETTAGRYRVPVSVANGSAAPEQSKASTDVPKTIPDNNPTGVSSSVAVTGSGTLAKVDVTIARITHPYVGDLQFELIGPDGTRVMLADRPGGILNAGDNFVNTVFSDDATIPLSAGTAPYTGTFKPQGGRLAAFAGKPVQGTWTLRVVDRSENDVGSLVGWGVNSSAATCATSTAPKPTASFTASPNPAPTQTLVTFNSTSTGSIASQAWDLDDDGVYDDAGGSSAGRLFPKAGTYTVGLRVTDSTGASATTSQTVTITNRKPVAAFSVSPDPAPAGSTVTFTSTSTDQDGTIASQAWDLDNDGAYDDGTATTATRSFSTPGTYTVGLKVTDDNGDSGTLSKTVTISSGGKPTAAFTVSPNPVPTGSAVTFTSTSSDADGTVASLAWDLDNDGAYDDATGGTASRSFATAGSYTVGLKVTDNTGNTDATTRVVTVTNRAPTASFTATPNPVATKTTVTFRDTSTDPDGTIASRAWDLDGDGAYDDSTAASPTKSWPKAGSYTVRLRVTDDKGATAAATLVVSVTNRKPNATFSTTSAPASGPALTEEQMTFTDNSSDPDGTIDARAWDLDGDGAFDDATGATASWTYSKAGTYTVGLEVTDDEGATDVTTRTVEIAGRPPSASFTVAPQTVPAGEPTKFDAATSTDPDGSIVKYEWDLDGDGSYETDTGSSPVTSRFYVTPGHVVVGLKVTDDDNHSATTERTVTVTEPSPFVEDPQDDDPGSGPLPGVNDGTGAPDPGQMPPDTDQTAEKPPRGALRVVTRKLGEARRRGLAVRFSSTEAATARFTVTTHSRRAGSMKRLVGAGRSSARLKLSRRVRAGSRVTVKLTLTGATGLRRTYKGTVVLRRR